EQDSLPSGASVDAHNQFVRRRLLDLLHVRADDELPQLRGHCGQCKGVEGYRGRVRRMRHREIVSGSFGYSASSASASPPSALYLIWSRTHSLGSMSSRTPRKVAW